ncbi:hypothetical protein AXG93_4339s1000 [Marchantia polymorpha subsp. ruderalis]|uniref:Uncharacterized protein n=1 Tax=Marchantia polymorpha subsp. ruderalis TaxID=1480154 RepID=A0A176W1D9_MARPO|nr:hypothetical protein AXG93_4339s1000 [Marchantia polymorpha subsp. ruderalis]
MVSVSNAAEHGDGFDANPLAVAIHLHDTLAGGSPSYLSLFLINFYRGMNLLTGEESRAFPMRNVEQEGEEVVLANEVNSDLEGESRSSPQ